MEIVVLDGYLVERRDLTFDCLQEFGKVTVYPDTKPEEIARRVGGAQAVFINRTHLGENEMKQCPNLRFIGITGTGYNMVDLLAAKKAGITVCNVPAYSTQAVAQMAFALLLNIVCSVSLFNTYIHAGHWKSAQDPFIAGTPLMELYGKTFGIIGMGTIGKAAARMARGFGMKVLGCSRRGLSPGLVDYETVLTQSDMISIHCPLTEETCGMINRQAISKMKRGAILINTARGKILDEAAVARALDDGKLYAVGADVLSQEPPQEDHPLARHPRCIVTPHVAWAPRETRERLLAVCRENLRLFLEGRPQNVVIGG